MSRFTCLLLLTGLAGCVAPTLDQPAATVPTADAEAARQTANDKALAAAYASEGYRLMKENRDGEAAASFFKALELDRGNNRALAGIELIHDRSGSGDGLIDYVQMISLYAQAARGEIDHHLAEATEEIVKTNFQAAHEKVATARLVLDSRRSVFGGPELRALRDRIEGAAKTVARARQQYEWHIRRVREETVRQLRMQQLRNHGRAWATYAN